ncbi:hypothetical protein AU255_02170 [Methyloprofundus sedimenti]|uniref:HTH cro/C1-type domain-containing protein n=1 Tax=Methyloprofundus sedimenti TaxID=1420851 RepID=A0A1V8M5A3_9GAMM|nr:helix-turn-helix transcriptional regulator [Methyloprofundus sedimenti]OQK16735.1 hypothetical protein AU255_02170 [Methyloprofundus sedimenti]
MQSLINSELKKSESKPEPAKIEPIRPGNKAEISMLTIVGSRLMESRRLCLLNRRQAADLLGVDEFYLGRLENALDADHVQLELIRRAAEVFDVSIDYLFGITDDWERDPVVCYERQVGQWMYEEFKNQLLSQAVQQQKLLRKIDSIDYLVKKSMISLENIFTSLDRFRELNSEFDDMRGGNNLVNSIEKFKRSINVIQARLLRAKVLKLKLEKLPNEK